MAPVATPRDGMNQLKSTRLTPPISVSPTFISAGLWHQSNDQLRRSQSMMVVRQLSSSLLACFKSQCLVARELAGSSLLSSNVSWSVNSRRAIFEYGLPAVYGVDCAILDNFRKVLEIAGVAGTVVAQFTTRQFNYHVRVFGSFLCFNSDHRFTGFLMREQRRLRGDHTDSKSAFSQWKTMTHQNRLGSQKRKRKATAITRSRWRLLMALRLDQNYSLSSLINAF